jgi:acyl carrier protein
MLSGASAGELFDLVGSHLLKQLGKVLHMDPSQIDPSSTFASLGMDSVMSLELRNRLESDLGLRLSPTLLFTYSTPVSLTAHLVEKVAPSPNSPPSAQASKKHPEVHEPPQESPRTMEEVEAALEAKLASLEKYLK